MVNKVAAARAVMKGKVRQDGNLPIVAFVDTSESYSVRASNVFDDEIAKSIKDKFGWTFFYGFPGLIGNHTYINTYYRYWLYDLREGWKSLSCVTKDTLGAPLWILDFIKIKQLQNNSQVFLSKVIDIVLSLSNLWVLQWINCFRDCSFGFRTLKLTFSPRHQPDLFLF